MSSSAALLQSIPGTLAAISGLGTAAYGLVDAFKAWGGGISNAGFGYIRRAASPFLSTDVSLAFGKKDIMATLQANWINGVDKAEQKAKAKALIRLGLTSDGSEQLANAAGIDATELKLCAERISNGTDLTPEDLNVLGRFDAVVSAVLDEGYERADQQYRNAAKFTAAIVGIGLAAIGGALIYDGPNYFASPDFGLAILVGAISTPLAPIAKDLSTALNAAVKAVSSGRR